MSEYIDTKLINCNRLASIESRSKNDTNPAIFTNPLNESIKLNVGDKISLERAFISEVGAGKASTIEFKGDVNGTNPVGTYTKIVPDDYYYKRENAYDPKYRLGYYNKITTEEVSDQEVELRDNLAPLVIGYYITSNEHPNYIQQPRKHSQNNDARGSVPIDTSPGIYSEKDGINSGRCFFTTNDDLPCYADYRRSVLDDEARVGFNQKVDNVRYTLYIKDKIAYTPSFNSASGADENYKAQFPKHTHDGIFQEGKYYRYRERIDIEVNKGFNTPSAIGEQISRQLTETKNEQLFEINDPRGYSKPITKTIETNTYKPINCQNLYYYCNQTYQAFVNQALPITDNIEPTQLSIDYISTFGYIAVKRPELYEAGRLMNSQLVGTATVSKKDINDVIEVEDFGTDRPFEGFQSLVTLSKGGNTTTNVATEFVTNVRYTKENCEKMRAYLDKQILYPELWDNLEQGYYDDTHLGGLQLPTIDNSRMFHINKFNSNSNLNSIKLGETFGYDGFTQGDTIQGQGNFCSRPLFFKYDESKKDTFISGDNYAGFATNGLAGLGFCWPYKTAVVEVDGSVVEDYFIVLDLRTVGGIPQLLYTDTGGEIFSGRRIGYDQHASAYGTAIITPYSGYSNIDIGTEATQNDGAKASDVPQTFTETINHFYTTTESGADATTVDYMPYMTQTYVGANNPELIYNDTNDRFEFSKLHTANNIGNKAKAGNKAESITSESMTPGARLTLREVVPVGLNPDSGSTVYKINPRPIQFGYSPTFKPYIRDNFAIQTSVYPKTATDYKTNYVNDGTNTQIYEAYNENIQPYTVFDSHGGIYIDNWGFDGDNWEDNLWDILGFDYNATNAEPSALNVLTKRVDNENNNLLYRPTTNAEIFQTDTKSYVANQHNAKMHYTSLPFPMGVCNYKATHDGSSDFWMYNGMTSHTDTPSPSEAEPLLIYPQLDIATTSTTITATDLQKSVLRPYYTIRSNILEGATAIGGNPTGANLPIIAIVDKYSAANDYFMGNPSSIQFTVTKPTMIADIKTSIHDSDGRYANVDKTSAVIYKIEKLKRPPVNIVQQILEQEADTQKKKK